MRRVVTIVALVVVGGAAGAAEPLKGPVDVEARRALIGKPAGAFACAAPPAPVRDVLAEPFYADRAGSIVDAARYAARVAAVKPLSDFGSGIARIADRWLGAKPLQPEAAACALDWLDAWARADAMLATVTGQGGYERKWALAGLALAYLKIRDAPGLDAEKQRRAEAWLQRLGYAMKAYYERPPGQGISDKINNHLYWAALAAAAAGIAAQDRGLFDWAAGRYLFALTQIAADGTLPLELARAGKALHYHLFSVTPLVMVAELGAANGLDLYAEQGGALGRHRLERRLDGDLVCAHARSERCALARPPAAGTQ
ncbi:MAG: alginate lyase family protein [Proteobacteria bacterium]|nr:alginate lyase family protein [Pseudomonadota bacterium]